MLPLWKVRRGRRTPANVRPLNETSVLAVPARRASFLLIRCGNDLLPPWLKIDLRAVPCERFHHTMCLRRPVARARATAVDELFRRAALTRAIMCTGMRATDQLVSSRRA